MPRSRTVDDDEILAAAAAAVGEVGPSRVTLADVGAKVGLAPATLLQRFGSKRGLLLALAAHGAETMPNRIGGAAHADDPLTSLVESLTSSASAFGNAREFANHLAFLLLDLSDPDFQEISRRHANAVRQAILDVLSVVASKGGLREGVDPDQAGELVYAVYNGALVTWGMAPVGRPGDAVELHLSAVSQLIRSVDE